MPSLSATKKRKSPAERVNNDAPLKKIAGPSCSIDRCKNKAVGGGTCIKHGGKPILKKCSVEGCDKFSKKRGVCISHGAVVIPKKCSHEGCDKNAKRQGVCISHGAMVIYKRCSVDGCDKFAQSLGVCVSHGAVTCSIDGCKNNAARGGICRKHGGKQIPNKCSVEGCVNIVKNRRVCISHGAVVNYKQCSDEGCDKLAQAQGVCASHGAITKRCNVDGCGNIKGGVCKRHWSQSHSVQLEAVTNEQRREGCVSQNMERIEVVENAAMLNKVIEGGICRIPKKCSVEGYCDKFAHRRGVYSSQAMARGKRCCCVDGCDKLAQNGGVCHLDEEQVNKLHSCTKQAKVRTLDCDEDSFSDEEEELLGALIYKFSRTAQLRAEQAQLQKKEMQTVIPRRVV